MMRRLLFSAFSILILICLPAKSSFAYLDPGTGSLIIQAVVGGVAGLLVIIKLYWVKIKRRFSHFSKHEQTNDAPTQHQDDSTP